MRISKSPCLTTSLTLLGFLSVTGAALAADGAPSSPDMPVLTGQLMGLFVVATVMESALTTIFTWRLYREFFNGRAMKTLVMIGFGFAVVKGFDYDIFHDVVIVSRGKGDSNWLSIALSSLVLAGGSAAINKLFQTLGLRAPNEAPDAAPKPEHDKAWISVRVLGVAPQRRHPGLDRPRGRPVRRREGETCAGRCGAEADTGRAVEGDLLRRRNAGAVVGRLDGECRRGLPHHRRRPPQTDLARRRRHRLRAKGLDRSLHRWRHRRFRRHRLSGSSGRECRLPTTG